MTAPRPLIVIPLYNHAATVAQVARGCLAHGPVLVVDDGSTDGGLAALGSLQGQALLMERHLQNRGKGAAILTAARKAEELGYSHIVTIDADGQHDPGDIPAMVAAMERDPRAIVIGARDFSGDVPGISRFGRNFSNFWLRLQTGCAVSDTQSGFRVYPVRALRGLRYWSTRYDFEVEVLACASWAGVVLQEIPIRVYYPPKEERVSHFDKLRDNIRISLLNTRLTVRSFLPWPHRRLEPLPASQQLSLLRPVASLRALLVERVTPVQIAWAGAMGIFIGMLPTPGLSTLLILGAAGWLGLNRFVALAFAQLCMPPVAQALGMEAGHYLRHGVLLTDISMNTLAKQAGERLLEYVLGALALAPLLAGLCWIFLWLATTALRVQLEGRQGHAGR